jgi:transcriptional regulator with XRE-family HTH domain
MRIRMKPQTLLCVAAFDSPTPPRYRREMSDELSKRIVSVRRELGMKQSDFAIALGVNQATVSRWESGSIPEIVMLGRIASMAGRPLDYFSQADVDLYPSGPRLYIKGEVAAGVWKEALEWERDDWQPYQGGSHFEAPAEARFGLRVAGESMNEIYPNGTVLDCVSCIHAGIEGVENGQRVIVVRRKFTGEIEATVKEYRQTAEGRWLVPRSSNPAFQTPIPLEADDPEIEETAIIAIVKGSYRPE